MGILFAVRVPGLCAVGVAQNCVCSFCKRQFWLQARRARSGGTLMSFDVQRVWSCRQSLSCPSHGIWLRKWPPPEAVSTSWGPSCARLLQHSFWAIWRWAWEHVLGSLLVFRLPRRDHGCPAAAKDHQSRKWADKLDATRSNRSKRAFLQPGKFVVDPCYFLFFRALLYIGLSKHNQFNFWKFWK